ncbi:MAG: glycosyltransferase [Candidatus Methanomethylicia archaeon]|nr:glycosyltransferase [Candidatus Methanomethylicia archaeon]
MLYVYPQFHIVSFTIIAKKHIEYIKKLKLANIQELDEISFPSFTPGIKYTTILHPWIYIYHRFLQIRSNALNENPKDRFQKYLDNWRKNFDNLIAVDVVDSDRLSEYAVNLLNNADKIIAPSNFCIEVLKNCGVKREMFRIPHGVDPEWYCLPNQWGSAPVQKINPLLLEVFLHKIKKNKKVLLYFLWHSPDRKGWSEVKEFYKRLVKERKDVVLVLKTYSPYSREFYEVMNLGVIQVYGWLNDYEKICLYDLADIYLNFSRGGAFEHNTLESLARGVPVIASDFGSWKDYIPGFLRVKTGERVQVLPGNLIHIGYGYKVDVEDALNKAHDILENYDDYKAKVNEYRKNILAKEYNWENIAKRLVEVISE